MRGEGPYSVGNGKGKWFSLDITSRREADRICKLAVQEKGESYFVYDVYGIPLDKIKQGSNEKHSKANSGDKAYSGGW